MRWRPPNPGRSPSRPRKAPRGPTARSSRQVGTMERRLVGRVAGLMRYPVKSMLGEELSETDITVGGVVGDRAWALREIVTGKIVSAKKFARMFEFRASYDSPPSADASAPVTIQLPDGKKIHASDPDASEIVSAALGRKVRLERPDGAKRERAG